MAIRFGVLAIGLTLCASTGAAQSIPSLSELRGGVLAHDIALASNDEEDGVDLNLELRLNPIGPTGEGLVATLLAPRPHLGLQVNTSGSASQIYAGLTWTFHLRERTWIGVSAGGTLHDGELGEGRRDHKALGSRALFRLALEIGYDLTERLSVALYFDHESNANLAEENEGLNNAGVRVGWRF